MTVRSPLAYQGSKWSLIPSLLAEFDNVRNLYDVFGGSATVSINAVGHAKRVFYNDHDERVVELLCTLSAMGPKKVISRLDAVINKHGLGRTKAHRSAYFAFRAYYNKRPNPFLLWVLSKHSFSSLIRFSSKGFNLPFGKRSPGKSVQRDRELFESITRLQSVTMSSSSYLQFVKRHYKRAKSSDLFYFDPPYLASGDNVYKGTWTEKDDLKLMQLLDFLDSLGLRWMLSNVTEHRGRINKPLKKWMKKYNVKYPTFNRSGEGYILNRATTSDPNRTVEVLITNY